MRRQTAQYASLLRHTWEGWGAVKTKYLFAALAALAIVAAIGLDPVPVSAQSTRPPRQRIEIRPGRLYYRECVDGLQVSHKYVGRTVLMPYMRCWWVRG
jgi:hypothetical protein